MTTSRNPSGRRGKPAEERRPETARFRCSVVEYDELCRAALRRGQSLSEYLRGRVFAREHVAKTLDAGGDVS